MNEDLKERCSNLEHKIRAQSGEIERYKKEGMSYADSYQMQEKQVEDFRYENSQLRERVQNLEKDK